MNLVVDASNILAGGGLMHLVEILKRANPKQSGFEKIFICAPQTTLDKIEQRPWLQKVSHIRMEGGYFSRWLWRVKFLPTLVKPLNALLFCPGAINPPFHWPYVTMCQNLLPLELGEIRRYGLLSRVGLRLFILRLLNVRAYKNSNGVIFLTRYCYEVLPKRIKPNINYKIIPHGIDHDLFHLSGSHPERDPEDIFKLLYVSRIDVYKNQESIVRAVIDLNKKGHRIELTLVGKVYYPTLKKINQILSGNKEFKHRIILKDEIAYDQMPSHYERQDAFIFGSSCETFGMILTEAMAMGMAIACSSRSSMHETLGDAGIYFDPFDVESVRQAIMKLFMDKKLRKELSQRAIGRAELFDWQKCADDTFSFLSQVARKNSL